MQKIKSISLHEKPFFNLKFKQRVLKSSKSLNSDIAFHGTINDYETEDALLLITQVWEKVRKDYSRLIWQREKDRHFIDQRCSSLSKYNLENKIEVTSEDYKTAIGFRDENDRIPFGPLREDFYKADPESKQIHLPKFLDGHHVTLFGPPGKEKMCINAMNAFHRKHDQEPKIIEEVLQKSDFPTKWGADDEDSKTPIHEDLVEAGRNLKSCFEGTLSFQQGKKTYSLEKNKLLQPIKRIPGLALPCTFLFLQNEAVPLHLYDFVLHLFHHHAHPERLAFYIPKLENDEEAAYIKQLIRVTSEEIRKINPGFDSSTIKLFIVLENPRAIFRLNEIIDALSPNFAGASLGWHDFLASTARLFKQDPNYRIPVKADPNIVIKYIKASHELVADIVGERGGIPIGGMYGILPVSNDLNSESYQLTLLGFFKDVVTQLKRGLKGFWVAHPDFIRLGQALTIAFEDYKNKKNESLLIIFKDYLNNSYFKEIKEFLEDDDVSSLNPTSKKFARSLIVADIKESNFISNNDPTEIEYNIFQSLQYLTDWLCGNGCVALPAKIGNTPVRVMDDLATAERSRWELWHEVNHCRFDPLAFIHLCHQEMNFIRKKLQTKSKITQVNYTASNAKWYKVAFHLLMKVVLDPKPPEFLPEVLLPFTLDFIQEASDPWSAIQKYDKEKFKLQTKFEKYSFYFEMCGVHEFAKHCSSVGYYDSVSSREMILGFSLKQLNSAASFHGDIGQKKETLDELAKTEQSAAKESDPEGTISSELLTKGIEYFKKFNFKFLVSAKGKSSPELLELINNRMARGLDEEFLTAKSELFAITDRRVRENSDIDFIHQVEKILEKNSVDSLSFSLSLESGEINSLNFYQGKVDLKDNKYIYQMASLSKTMATYFCLNFFADKCVSIDSSVSDILVKYNSKIVISNLSSDLKIRHLLNHSAMNMHYVNGIPEDKNFPTVEELLLAPEQFGYKQIEVCGDPGKSFQYSGGGFILLEYLIGLINKEQNIFPLIDKFYQKLGCETISSNPKNKNFNSKVTPHNDLNKSLESELFFPSFAAGMTSHPKDVIKVLKRISEDFNSSQDHCLKNTRINIGHTLARQMLHGEDFGSCEFMHAKAALGTFIIEGAENYFMIHQGANDGYRSFYLYCFKGLNKGFGLCLFSTGEEKSVLAISKIIQLILVSNNIAGINSDLFNTDFNHSEFSQDEKVNRGYKELFLKAFELEKAASYPRRNFSLDLFEHYNLTRKPSILSVTDQKFAPAENLLSPYQVDFDPTLFGNQGKVMDSWESSRHSVRGYEELIFSCEAIKPKFVFVSTEYHDGNHVESITLIASKDETFNLNETLLDNKILQGNSWHLFKLEELKDNYTHFKLKTFPDGGLTRIKFFDQSFLESKDAKVFKEHLNKAIRCSEIPQINKGYTIPFQNSEYEVVKVSNEHYSQASSILSPYDPLDMFDGGESARSRKNDNCEVIKIRLKKEKVIKKILIDFKFFINNSPLYLSLNAMDNDGEKQTLLQKVFVKPYRGNFALFEINSEFKCKFITLKLYPDGGINRVKFL
ncbi:aldolase/citrate lyase family protein [Bacteriovoracaceae bacterium]|nr:aldolase/citrate lyase family protein [Bacteriovoracaceae bacterium]